MNALNRYKTSQRNSASKPQALVLLYREARRRLRLARRAMKHGERDASQAHLEHARRILGELAALLDDDLAPELCANLRRLYAWGIVELSAAHREQDPSRIAGVDRSLASLLGAWQAAVSEYEREQVA